MAHTNPAITGADRAAIDKSANWTTQLLADYLQDKTKIAVDQETVREYLHRHDYVYKRPNWTVQHKAQEREGYLGNA